MTVSWQFNKLLFQKDFLRIGLVKTILLLRHAKSAWSDPRLDDHERPLNRRGEQAAKAMADHIARQEPRPDLILCSTAMRTRQTLAPLIKLLDAPAPPIALEKGLYLASEDVLLAHLQAVGDEYRHRPADRPQRRHLAPRRGAGRERPCRCPGRPAGKIPHRHAGHAAMPRWALARPGAGRGRTGGLRAPARPRGGLGPLHSPAGGRNKYSTMEAGRSRSSGAASLPNTSPGTGRRPSAGSGR